MRVHLVCSHSLGNRTKRSGIDIVCIGYVYLFSPPNPPLPLAYFIAIAGFLSCNCSFNITLISTQDYIPPFKTQIHYTTRAIIMKASQPHTLVLFCRMPTSLLLLYSLCNMFMSFYPFPPPPPPPWVTLLFVAFTESGG